MWKRSFVVPVFKSGDKHNIANYRPISKICAIPKMFERIVYDFLFPLIRPHIIEQQHGFISHRSTETNLCEFLDYVLSSMEDGHQVDVVYTDYSKAFDRINFDILIEKLHGLGVHGDLLRWLESYVRDRSQAVTFNGFCSSFAPVPSGVPQGSHLGPMLFNIYVNDVPNVFRKSKFIMYADDKKVYKVIRSLNDCLELQDDLNNLFVYCQNNLLTVNTNKCTIITFSRGRSNILYDYSINGQTLVRTTVVRDLGIYLDSSLIFDFHVNEIVNKAFRMLG
ncbi:reverse transcriptase family protein, partial [Acinetobacter baumannii]